jgi:hypothetical protein
MSSCTYLDPVQITDIPESVDGWGYLATGDRWLHLRSCLDCGNFGAELTAGA